MIVYCSTTSVFQKHVFNRYLNSAPQAKVIVSPWCAIKIWVSVVMFLRTSVTSNSARKIIYLRLPCPYASVACDHSWYHMLEQDKESRRSQLLNELLGMSPKAINHRSRTPNCHSFFYNAESVGIVVESIRNHSIRRLSYSGSCACSRNVWHQQNGCSVPSLLTSLS